MSRGPIGAPIGSPTDSAGLPSPPLDPLRAALPAGSGIPARESAPRLACRRATPRAGQPRRSLGRTTTSQPTKRSSRSACVSELPNFPPSSDDRYGCPPRAADDGRVPDRHRGAGTRLARPTRSPATASTGGSAACTCRAATCRGAGTTAPKRSSTSPARHRSPTLASGTDVHRVTHRLSQRRAAPYTSRPTRRHGGL